MLQRLLAVTVLLAPAVGGAGCGDSSAAGGELAPQLDLGRDVTAELRAGVFREPDGQPPKAWLTHPTANVAFRSGVDAPPERTLRVANRPPNGTIELASARYLTASDREECGGAPNGGVDCSTSSDPLCSALSVDPAAGGPTVADVTVDLPPCAEISARWQFRDSASNPLRIGLVGPADGDVDLAGLVERRSGRTAMTVLTGDYADSPDAEEIETLAEQLEGLNEPVVVLPGEAEVSPNSSAAFRELFGPVWLRWRLEGIEFLTYPSPRQTIEPDDVERLDSELQEVSRSEPIVALTHTPPHDPKSLRGRGFDNETEATRTISVLTDHRVDLLAAGHLGERRRETYGNLTMLVPPGVDGGEKLVVTLRPGSGGGKLGVEVDGGG